LPIVHGRRASANRARSESRLGSDSALNNRGDSSDDSPLQHCCGSGEVLCFLTCAIMQTIPPGMLNVKSQIQFRVENHDGICPEILTKGLHLN